MTHASTKPGTATTSRLRSGLAGILAGALAASLGLTAAAPAGAQGYPGPRSPYGPGVIVQRQPNVTGNGDDLVIARGATGADTVTTNSAAGGNASFPERAVPNGSANGGGGGGNR